MQCNWIKYKLDTRNKYSLLHDLHDPRASPKNNELDWKKLVEKGHVSQEKAGANSGKL